MGAVEALLYNGLDAFRGTGQAISDVIAGSSGNDELYGLDGDDTLSGNGGADYIFGGDGNDQINGGVGDDRLSGGAGADLFVFADAGVDTVVDFAAGSDRIFLDRAVFTGLGAGALAGDLFARGDTAIDADDRILYNPDTGVLLYDADGSGATDAILFGIISVPSGVLGASDFFVI
jgi:Ca2+-binding RTX toxin-like protein